MEDKNYKKIINAWAMHDWANSAFATKIIAAVLPIYFSVIAKPELTSSQSTAYWGVSLIIFFISGALLLTRVDEEKGIQIAQEADACAVAEV